MIYLERESVLQPYSSLFKGNVKSAIKQQYEPSAIVPRQSNHVGYGRPRQNAIRKAKKEACVFERSWTTAAKVWRGLSLVNKDYFGGDYTELGLLRWTALHAVCLADMTQPEPLSTTFSSSTELIPL